MSAIAALPSNGAAASLETLSAAGKPAFDFKAKAREQAVDFEAMFLNSMMSQMFTDTDADGPFGGGGSAGVWRSFLTEEYSKSFAKAGGIGIADQVYRALLQQQEAHGTTGVAQQETSR